MNFTKMSDPILFDTNILVYAHNKSSSFHKHSLGLVNKVKEGEIKGALAQQNLVELYSIVTDKRRVDKPISPKLALELAHSYLNSPFEIIFPTEETSDILLSLCKNISVKNGAIFDVYLAATMIANNIKTIVTLNSKDFKSFPNIKVLDLATNLS